MSKVLERVPFFTATPVILSEALKQWTSSTVPAEATEALRFALASPTTAPAENLDCIRQLTRKTRLIFDAMAKKSKNGCSFSGVLISQLKDAGNFLSVADALTFPDTPNGAGARSRWANPMVNVERIPEIARAFLWPERFTLTDHGVASDVLFDAADALLGAVCLYEDKGHKTALLGFELADFISGAALLQTMQAALPIARETMTDLGREYTATTSL